MLRRKYWSKSETDTLCLIIVHSPCLYSCKSGCFTCQHYLFCSIKPVIMKQTESMLSRKLNKERQEEREASLYSQICTHEIHELCSLYINIKLNSENTEANVYYCGLRYLRHDPKSTCSRRKK